MIEMDLQKRSLAIESEQFMKQEHNLKLYKCLVKVERCSGLPNTHHIQLHYEAADKLDGTNPDAANRLVPMRVLPNNPEFSTCSDIIDDETEGLECARVYEREKKMRKKNTQPAAKEAYFKTLQMNMSAGFSLARSKPSRRCKYSDIAQSNRSTLLRM